MLERYESCMFHYVPTIDEFFHNNRILFVKKPLNRGAF